MSKVDAVVDILGRKGLVVLIEHDISRARSIADRLVVMDDGRLNPFLSETKTLRSSYDGNDSYQSSIRAAFVFFLAIYLMFNPLKTGATLNGLGYGSSFSSRQASGLEYF